MITTDIFKDIEFDPTSYAKKLNRLSEPKISYIIFFTPRSGSSWLTNVLSSTDCLGHPGEFFNPNFVPKIAARFGTNTLDRYFELLKRQRKKGDVFGIEVTYGQLQRFPGEEVFCNLLPHTVPHFCLLRRDIILQAVSLAKAVDTKIFHSVQKEFSELQEREKQYHYDAKLIERWLRNIWSQERQLEEFFNRYGYKPIYITYEDMISAGPLPVIKFFAQRLGVDINDIAEPSSTHQKVGTSQNEEYAERFRQANGRLLAKIDRERQIYLDRAEKL